MRAKWVGVAEMLVLLLVIGQAGASENKDFYSDGDIMTGEQWNVVNIYDTPPNRTIVDMSGGLVDNLKPQNFSTFNMTDGKISTLIALDNSISNLSGGSVYTIGAMGTSVINLSGTIDIFVVDVIDSGSINITGGLVDGLVASNYGIINLYGGIVTDYLGAIEFSKVNVFGYNLVKTSTGGHYGYGQVYGFYNDGSSFSIDLSGSETYSHIDLIPEPGTLLLLLIGVGFLRNRNCN